MSDEGKITVKITAPGYRSSSEFPVKYPPDYCACGGQASECGGYETFCWSCNRHEEQPESVYRVCFECNHVYVTAADLEKEFHEQDGFARSAGDIYSCPLCIHDW